MLDWIYLYIFLFAHVLNNTKGLGKVTKINEVVLKAMGKFI